MASRPPVQLPPATAVALSKARACLALDPQHAAALARQAAKSAPAAIEPSFVLGAALRRTGDFAGALAVLAPLAAALPGLWGVQFEHGMALATLGQCKAAAAALERAVAANPSSSLAAHALGDQLALLGRDAEAAALHALPRAGGIGDRALLDAAAALFDGGDAGPMLARLGLHLNDLAAMRLLADAGIRLGRFGGAAALLDAALAVAPGFLPARYARALASFRLDLGEAALADIEVVLMARTSHTGAFALRAAILMQLGDAAGAIDDYAAALAVAPEDPALLLGHGHALRAAGRRPDAVAAYRRAATLNPGDGEAWWSLANLKTWRFKAGDIAAMRAAAPGDAWLDFALGKALEDAGDFASAFEHYRRGNTARHAAAPYDAAAAGDLLRRTAATFDAAFVAVRAGAGDPAPDPIFIVGMPRSGSTLIEQILASHSEVEGLSELPDLPAIARRVAGEAAAAGQSYPDGLAALLVAAFTAMGRDYLDRTRVRRTSGRPFFVDKFPGNYLHAGLIALILPNARIIDVRRGAMACCVSLYKQAFADGQAYSYDLGDLGRTYRGYVELMAHFDTVLPGRIVRVSYEALVDAPEAGIRDLLDRLGLPFEPACLRFYDSKRVVRTPSSEQVRLPIFRDGLDQWRHFEPWLGPLRDSLGALAD